MKPSQQKSKLKGGGRRRRVGGWMAVGALAVYSSSSNQEGRLYAQQTKGSSTKQAAAVDIQLPTRRLSIAAGPLDDALASFQSSTGVKVLIHLPEDTIQGFRTDGASGDLRLDAALEQLLARTGLSSRFMDANTAMIEVAHSSESVTVSAAPIQLGLSDYTQPILDTPQTITVVPQAVMQEQGVTTLRDALRNVAGISMAAGEGGSQGDNLTIRGFTARNDIFLDGMRDFGSYYRDSFNYEQVEVLQGPSSVTFGRGSTGGVVNQVSKSPEMARIMAGSLNFGTNGLMRLTADIDEPVKALGNGAAFRLNLMGTQTGVAGRDAAEYRRWGAAPSLAWGLGSPTQSMVSYFHAQENDIPDYGIPWLFNGPAPVDRNNYYGFPSTNYLRTDVDMGTFRIDHRTSNGIAIHNQLRYAHYNRNAQITEAQILGTVTLNTPLDQIMINRNQISVNSTESMLDDQFDVNFSFNTSRLHHNLVTGLEATRETSDPTRPTWTGVPTTSLLSPNDAQPFAGTFTISSDVHTTGVTVGAYAIDTLQLGPHWEVTGGLRWDRFSADYNQTVAPGANFSRVDNMPTYRAALVYKPVGAGSIYFDYGTSFNPSAESLSLSAGTANLPPEHNETFEVGTKWDLHRGRTSLRASLFRTEKTNAREPDPDNPLLQVLAGKQLVEGFEAEVAGRLTERWQLMGGYALLNSRVLESVYYPAAVGGRLANVPSNTFNLWSTYDLPWHFQFGTGTNFVESRSASSTVPIDPITGLVKQVPSYWVFNAMVKYQISERVNVQVNVNNLADRYYYDEIHPAHIVPGEARNALVGLNFSF